MELKIDLGAGQSNLKLGVLNLTRLQVNMGFGQADVDLTGPRNSDLMADISGGVGQATVRLPKDVGVVATASGGIGDIRAHGLREENGEYVNDAYGKSPHTIHLKVSGGIGQINLDLEP
jgi:predicted membrane protein